MKNPSKFLAVVAIFLMGGCASSYMVNSDHDRTVNFREYTSYRIVNEADAKGDPILNSSLNQKRINSALEAELKARGYAAKENDADLIIKYQTDVRDKQDVQSFNNGGYWGWYGNNNVRARSYEQTRLVINLIDAKSNQLVWQGWATGEAKKASRDRDEATRDVVYRIMREYPHRAGGGVAGNTDGR